MGSLEQPIMEAVWELEEASVADVLAQMPDEPAYTTVKTVMERMEKKGLLVRTKIRRAYTYRPALSRAELEAQASGRMVESLLQSFGSAAVAQFAQTVREDPAQLAELRELLADLPDESEEEEQE